MRILAIVAFVMFFPAVAAAQGNDCAALLKIDTTSLPTPKTMLTSATVNTARPAQGNVPAFPQHCEVQGKINERVRKWAAIRDQIPSTSSNSMERPTLF